MHVSGQCIAVAMGWFGGMAKQCMDARATIAPTTAKNGGHELHECLLLVRSPYVG